MNLIRNSIRHFLIQLFLKKISPPPSSIILLLIFLLIPNILRKLLINSLFLFTKIFIPDAFHILFSFIYRCNSFNFHEHFLSAVSYFVFSLLLIPAFPRLSYSSGNLTVSIHLFFIILLNSIK